MGAKYSIKTDQLSFDDIEHAIDYLRSYFSLTVVEIVDNSASLYSSSIQNHPVCILVKYLVSRHFFLELIYAFYLKPLFFLNKKNDKSLAIDGKSTNGSLIENLLEEFKAQFKSV